MVNFEIRFKRSAQKDLKRFNKDLILRILSNIEDLSKEPIPRNSKKLKGVENIFRVRVGKYMVVYEINQTQNLVTIYYVRHRDDVYRNI